jgi:hypothetical protein
MPARCPLYPQKRTLELSRGMSALCQKETNGSAAIWLFRQPPSSDFRQCGGEHVVRRQRTPNTLERKLAHGLDRYGIFYCRENARTD